MHIILHKAHLYYLKTDVPVSNTMIQTEATKDSLITQGISTTQVYIQTQVESVTLQETLPPVETLTENRIIE